MTDDLGNRMKTYEDVTRYHLPRRMPVIVRLDGKAFHNWTRGLSRPYCQSLMTAMDEVTRTLCAEVQNTVLAYTQSDEISLLLVDYKQLNTASWFDSNLQKMVSVAAGIASSKLTALSSSIFTGITLKEAVFDARAFVIPESDVNNYFVWRQQDCRRNSLAMLAQSMFSPKILHGKNQVEQHRMCSQKGVDWDSLDSHLRNGRIVVKQSVEKAVARYNTKRAIAVVNPVEGQVEAGLKFTAGAWEPVPVIRREWRVLKETPLFSSDPSLVEGFVKI